MKLFFICNVRPATRPAVTTAIIIIIILLLLRVHDVGINSTFHAPPLSTNTFYFPLFIMCVFLRSLCMAHWMCFAICFTRETWLCQANNNNTRIRTMEIEKWWNEWWAGHKGQHTHTHHTHICMRIIVSIHVPNEFIHKEVTNADDSTDWIEARTGTVSPQLATVHEKNRFLLFKWRRYDEVEFEKSFFSVIRSFFVSSFPIILPQSH